MAGNLYLIPVLLSDTNTDKVLPSYNIDILNTIKHFIVEDIRSARRFIKKCNKNFDIDACTFYTLNQHTKPEEIAGYLKDLELGADMGIISEAGCPAIADPGADIVAIAQEKNYKVIPLVGPSSILMAVMGSGFNGQKFCFEGYLPIDKNKKESKLKKIEQRSYKEDSTHLFIETPYRNNTFFKELITLLRPQTKLCIAFDITGKDEYIKTKTIKDWKKSPITLSKTPCIFAIYRG